MVSRFLTKVNGHKADLYTAVVIFFVGIGSFGLGRLSVEWPKKDPITITQQDEGNMEQEKIDVNGNESITAATSTVKGKYVASRSGKYYYAPWCGGALRIKEENKVWFETKEDAEKRGYKPAANCQGL